MKMLTWLFWAARAGDEVARVMDRQSPQATFLKVSKVDADSFESLVPPVERILTRYSRD